jgi:hypothetical protein
MLTPTAIEDRPAPPPTTINPASGATRGRRWRQPVVWAAGAGIASSAYVFFVNPNNPASAYPGCALKHSTGLDCPLCGGLRGTHDLLHGNLAGALHHNALLAIILPALAYLLFRWSAQAIGRDLPDLPSNRTLTVALGLFVLAFTIMRNIPGTPLYWFNSSGA